jgi:hypothetical protein
MRDSLAKLAFCYVLSDLLSNFCAHLETPRVVIQILVKVLELRVQVR